MKAGRIGISALLAVLMLGVLFAPVSVFAGNINGNEANIISQASGTFQYEGKTYVATQASLGQLTSYLSQDGIDLNADQASRALSLMYANVKAGVLDGILVPVGGSESSESKAADKEKENVIKQKAGKATVEIDKGKSQFTVTPSGKKDEIFTGQLPVKNTGFRLDSLLILLAASMCILPAAIIISYRFGLFAHKENGH